MGLLAGENRWHALWWGGVALFLALTCLLAPIKDPDFFWHLHTGQWIWEHRSLPVIDPFTSGGSGLVNPRQHFLLTSYWLSQLGYFGIYSLSGWSGFFVARAILLWLLIRSLLARRHDWPVGYALLTTAFLTILFTRFPVERPQFLSFLAFAVAAVLLDRLAEARDAVPSAVAWGLPVLMLSWGNAHGGVLLGQILCVAHLLYNTWRMVRGEISRTLFFRAGTVLAGALLASLLTPNWDNYLAAHREALDPKYQPFYAFNLEYRSLYHRIVEGKVWVYLFFPVTVLLAGWGLLRDGIKRNPLPVVLLLCFTIAAFNSVRYLPFLGILALPFAGNALAGFHRKLGLGIALLLLGGSLAGASQHFGNLGTLARNGPIAARYPQRAVEFVKESGLRGNLLNDYVWGGYLGWALGEGHFVFVDGRTLDLERYNDWILLSGVLGAAAPGAVPHAGRFGRERILDHILRKYQIDYMILPNRAEGQPFWLSQAMAAHPRWKTVYSDPQAVVFVRSE